MRYFFIFFLLLASPAQATTYNYIGQSMTYSYDSQCHGCTAGALSISVTFQMNTSNYTGQLYLTDGDSASSGQFTFPRQSGGNYFEEMSGSFELMNGQIVSWDVGGLAGNIVCGGGPACALDSFSSTPGGDSFYVYPNSESNTLPGTWTKAAAAPEPSTWTMMLLGIRGLGLLFHRQRADA